MTASYSARSESRVGRFFLRLFLAVLGLAVGLFAYVFAWLSKTHYSNVSIVDHLGGATVSSEYSDINQTHSGGRIPVYINDDFPIRKVNKIDNRVDNFLIIGVDSRGETTARTDTMMVMSVDKRHNAVKLTSLMRDIEVDLPGREGAHDKLNAAYSWGGIGLLINTVNENFNLDIQRFMMVDFWSSAKIIDEIGGVYIHVSEAEVEATNNILDEMNILLERPAGTGKLTSAGEQKLDGTQAIAWARIRSIDSDHARTGRQRQVVTAIFSEFSKLSLPKKLSATTTILENMETNMTQFDIMGMGFNALGALNQTMEYKVPKDTSMYTTNTSNWNILLNWEAQVADLHRFIYEEAPAD